MTNRRKVTTRWICALTLLFSAIVPVTAAAPAQAMSSASLATYETAVIKAINTERVKHGRKKIVARYCPDVYAERWASKIRSSSLRHQSMTPILRYCHASRVAENIARGNVSATKIVAMWMKSPGHRANILDARLTQIGVAAVYSSGRYTVVADFARA